MDWIGWLITAFSLTGVILNIRKKRICYVIWLFTNAGWCIYYLSKGLYASSLLFFVYFCLSIWGI